MWSMFRNCLFEFKWKKYLTILRDANFQLLVFLSSVLKINNITKFNKWYLICYRLKIASNHKIRFLNNMYNNLVCLGRSERISITKIIFESIAFFFYVFDTNNYINLPIPNKSQFRIFLVYFLFILHF